MVAYGPLLGEVVSCITRKAIAWKYPRPQSQSIHDLEQRARHDGNGTAHAQRVLGAHDDAWGATAVSLEATRGDPWIALAQPCPVPRLVQNPANRGHN